MADKQKKIDVAVRDARLKLKECDQNLMLLNREKKILQDNLLSLEIIQSNDQYE